MDTVYSSGIRDCLRVLQLIDRLMTKNESLCALGKEDVLQAGGAETGAATKPLTLCRCSMITEGRKEG